MRKADSCGARLPVAALVDQILRRLLSPRRAEMRYVSVDQSIDE